MLYKDGCLQVTLLRSDLLTWKLKLVLRKDQRPKDLRKSRIKYDEVMVSKCCDLLKQWPAMCDNSTYIVSLLSGVNASAEVKTQVAIQV